MEFQLTRMPQDLATTTIVGRKNPAARTKWLPEPGERQQAQLLVCVYARYSKPEQKQRSIDRQEERCQVYIVDEIDGAEYQLFSDPGQSATLLQDRPDLMALLELVKAGKVKHIVIEAMDRLTRVIWDATRIGELLEAYGVHLHVWNLGRSVSRQELVDEAKRAEADRIRRFELTSDGQHDLIRRGGMTIFPFGYEKSGAPGFPVRHPEQAKAVKRVFELVPFNSDADVAIKMSDEGFIGPSGTTKWDRWDVARICGNLIYIGVNNFRTTNQETVRLLDKEHEAAFGDINVRIKIVKNNFKRNVSEWVFGFNEERYAIVSDEEFVAADRARAARLRGPGGAARAGQKSSRDPFVNPTCDCPGRDSSQRYHFVYNLGNGVPAYQCSQQRSHHGCLSSLGHSTVRIEDVQRVVLGSLEKHALPLCESADFRADFIERIRARAADLDLRRAQMQREYDELDGRIDGMLNDAIDSGFGKNRLGKKVEKLEEELLQKKTDIAKLQKIDPDTVDVDNAAGKLLEAFDLVSKRLPFKAENQNETKVAARLQSMIGGVVVRRENVPVGQAQIEVALDVEGFVLGAEEPTERSWIIEKEQIRAMWQFKSDKTTTAALDELAASGRYVLTDDQWKILEPHLPDMSKAFGNISHTMSTRAVADACIFKYRTGAYQLRLPRMFGNLNEMRGLIPRFVRYGGMAEIIMRLSATDPSWAEGLDVPEFKAWSLRKNAFWQFEDSREMAATWAAEGRFSLTDAQFKTIETLIDPEVLKPTRKGRVLDGRQLVNGILLKLRCGINWDRMPAPWAKGSGLSGAAAALAHRGGWKKIVEALNANFPDILDELDVEIIERHAMGLEHKKVTSTARKKRAKSNTNGIFANIGRLLSSATKDTDLSVGLSGARIRVPGKRLLRPKVVVGPVDAVVGKIFTQPTIVVQRGHHKGHAQTLDMVALYRATRCVQQILVVSTVGMRIDHHERKDGKWTSRVLKEGDAVVIETMEVHLPLREIYDGADV